MQKSIKIPHVESQQESEWIDSAIKGDRNAFSKLYGRYHGQIYAFCTRMLQGRSEAEDAAQQVFLEAWRSLYRFERRSMFSTWITKIAIHTCLSFHRRSSRISLTADDDSLTKNMAAETLWGQKVANPDEQLWMTSRRKAVGRILNRMTSKKKSVFVMSDMQGMTAPEISGVLGIPDATVRTRLFHARREFLSSVEKSPYYSALFK